MSSTRNKNTEPMVLTYHSLQESARKTIVKELMVDSDPRSKSRVETKQLYN